MKNVADIEECSFASKIDDFYPRKTTVFTGLMSDAGASSYIIRDVKNL